MLHVPLVCALGLALATQSFATPKETTPVVGDVSGEWSGEVKTPISHSPIPMYFKLQQNGNDVSGSAGPGPASQSPISDVKRLANTLHFAVSAEGITYTFDLIVENDVLKGDARGEDRQSNTWTGKASLKRSKPAQQ